jgi:hypothetical protein
MVIVEVANCIRTFVDLRLWRIRLLALTTSYLRRREPRLALSYWVAAGWPMSSIYYKSKSGLEVFPDSCTSLARAHCFQISTITFAKPYLDVHTFVQNEK